MNIRNDLQPVPMLDRDIQVSSAEKSPNKFDSASLPMASDHADLSNAASIASQAASISDVREEKVQALQIKIASGAYQIDSKDVAQSMMDHMLGSKG